MRIKKIAEKFYKRPIIINICIAIVLNILLEIMARGSVADCISYIIGNSGKFIFNTLIILLPLTLTMFFRRRLFFTALISLIWFGLGFTNLMLLTFRSTPFSAVDFKLVSTAVDVFDVYLSAWQIILIISAVAMALGLAVMLWIKAPKYEGKRNLLKSLVFPAVTAIGLFVLNYSTAQAEEVSFTNLAEAYENYGFAYCFSVSVVDSGMHMPEDYSEESVADIMDSLSKDKENEKKPNVIFIQLESFFDVNSVKDLELSENPVPTFDHLKNYYTSGQLIVPCVGAGTANTEFEVLTGMSIQFFGAGEYPYKTVMTNKTTESMAYNMSELGYASQAIHNHRGTFYGREIVYSNLGFDTFTPLEYMQNTERTEKNWCKDYVLTDVIMDALNSTEEQDFLFTVSVQAHGQYPEEVQLTDLTIEATGPDEPEKTQVEYYVQQLKEVDGFLAELTDTLDNYSEDIVLVLYGDHLPSISYFDEFEDGDRYTTEYVVWSNYDIDKRDRDLSAYQLSAYVQELIGINSGTVTKYHQYGNYSNSDMYLNELEILQYDMLFGEGYSYATKGAHEPTKMTMGVKDIEIQELYMSKNSIYILGENFTEYSGIYADGVEVEAVYHTSGILSADIDSIQPGQEITVGQRNKDKIVLSYSEPYIYPATQASDTPISTAVFK